MLHFRNNCLCFLIAFLPFFAKAQQVVPLYQGKAPGLLPAAATVKENIRTDKVVGLLVSAVTEPTLEVFLPEKGKGNGTAVVICPGGGYGVLLLNREGRDVAKAFNDSGVAAFVLKYRLPSPTHFSDPAMAPLQDAQQAIQIVRARAGEWKIDPGKVGIMGFSAGGHLAATAGTHFGRPAIDNKSGVSLRPDFMILVNPVISFTDSIGHTGSRNNLLGPSPAPEQVRWFSNELQVTAQTPPAFLVHAGDDTVVGEKNSLLFYQKLRAHKIPGALHIYQKGEHGFLKDLGFGEWFGRCLFWMQQAGYL
ncbi:alpha/beta hydrolase [Chitinophaga sp.]|uniref:alpha/beta hydrolase n=1 Tax=Chitinophaga sp. TaxID=1869181 RepID=UPI0026119948|nr:alpha/beta hydrolase [uncultured Chitinophaga sp.]